MRRNKWNHIDEPVNAVAAQILEALDILGAWHQPVTVRAVVRKMNAYSVPDWDQALEVLLERKCITIEAGQRRQKLITILGVPEDLRPRQIVSRPKRKRKRGQTEWFKRHLADFRRRDGYDDGLQEQISMPGDTAG